MDRFRPTARLFPCVLLTSIVACASAPPPSRPDPSPAASSASPASIAQTPTATEAAPPVPPASTANATNGATFDGIWRNDAYRVTIHGDDVLMHKRLPCPRVPCASAIGLSATWKPSERTLAVVMETKPPKGPPVAFAASVDSQTLVLTSKSETLRLPRWDPTKIAGTLWSGDEWSFRFESADRYQRVRLPSCEHKNLAECQEKVLEKGTYRVTTWTLTLTRDHGGTDVYDLEWDDDLMIATLAGKTTQLNRAKEK